MQNTIRIFAFFVPPLRKTLFTSLICIPMCIGASLSAAAQEIEKPATAVSPVIPQQVRYAGKLATRTGDTVEAEFRIYATAEGGDPLWTETQHLTIAEDGSYSVLLGSASSAGLPQAVFAGGAARWLGVSVERSAEQERVLLSSVPYAMKSADAESLSGHAAADFVTQEQFAQLAQSAAQSGPKGTEPQPDTSGTVTGSGTNGTVPLWTGSLTQGNSLITQLNSSIGINEPAPAATLDVNGSGQFRGPLTLPATATATSSSSYHSQYLNFSASAWSSTVKAAVSPSFVMFAYPEYNNTASPAAKFYIQYRNGSNVTDVLSVNSAGLVGFAPGQTFPGTIASVSATSPVTATTTSGAVSLGLNTPALESALNGVYAQLGGPNAFTSYLSANASQGIAYSALSGFGTNGSMGVFGNSDSGYGVNAETQTGQAVFGQATAPTFASAGVLGSIGTTFSTRYKNVSIFGNAGVWADQSCCAGQFLSAALIATADSGYAGLLQNNSSNNPALSVENFTGAGALVTGTSGDGLEAVSSSNGNGLSGTSNNSGGDGVMGLALTPNSRQAGVLGVAGTASSTFAGFNVYSGIWGDTSGSSNSANAVTGTADGGRAGFFVNNSANYATLYTQNLSTGGTGLFKTFMATSTDGTCGIGGKGDISCTGQVKSLVSTAGGAHTVETYAPQSAENWMEDYGTGVMERGVSVVKIDPAFAETVSQSADYHVFITPRADSKGLYVINATAESFEVRESGGGTSSLTFDYKIVAKRRGYETQRLIDVTERFKTETAHVMPPSDARPTQNIRRSGPMVFKLNTNQSTKTAASVDPFTKKSQFQKRDTTKP